MPSNIHYCLTLVVLISLLTDITAKKKATPNQHPTSYHQYKLFADPGRDSGQTHIVDRFIGGVIIHEPTKKFKKVVSYYYKEDKYRYQILQSYNNTISCYSYKSLYPNLYYVDLLFAVRDFNYLHDEETPYGTLKLFISNTGSFYYEMKRNNHPLAVGSSLGGFMFSNFTSTVDSKEFDFPIDKSECVPGDSYN